MSYPTISSNPNVQSFYENCRRDGQSHNMAEMFALRTAPTLDTDTALFASHGSCRTLADQFPNKQALDNLIKAARKQGYNPSPNDIYYSPIAARRGDPKAFISQANGGKARIRDACIANGLDCEGTVNVKAPRKDPKPDIPLAADLVKEAVFKMVLKDPSLKRKPLRELQEAAIDKHGYKPK
jgi:hypothetical protein